MYNISVFPFNTIVVKILYFCGRSKSPLEIIIQEEEESFSYALALLFCRIFI